MREPPSKHWRLDDYMGAMISGLVPTAPAFVCPTCFGPARASASPHGEELSVSVRCPCSALELDGVRKWSGWESLLSPPPPDFDANPLRLVREQPPNVGIAFTRQRDRAVAVACAHCGAPLTSALAKQCFVCGTDWHDPQSVIRRVDPRKNPQRLKWKAAYAVELCQDPFGRRYTRHREEGVDGSDLYRVFDTPTFPGWQWVVWGEHGFASHVRTTTGVRFTFAADGVWLTWAEVQGLHRSLTGDVRRDEIVWATGKPPSLPPT